MSLATWQKEFYRKPAAEVSKKDAVNHSIQKWEGLSKANLEKHNLRRDGDAIKDRSGKRFFIDQETCALCVWYLDIGNDHPCMACPLYKVLGHSCDHGSNSPYGLFFSESTTKPMLQALRRARGNKTKRKPMGNFR